MNQDMFDPTLAGDTTYGRQVVRAMMGEQTALRVTLAWLIHQAGATEAFKESDPTVEACLHRLLDSDKSGVGMQEARKTIQTLRTLTDFFSRLNPPNSPQ